MGESRHGRIKALSEHDSNKSFRFSHRSLNRLKDLVAEHLDHLHYLNDILCLQIDALNAVLTDHLLNRLFIPLYIYSLGSNKGGPVDEQTAAAAAAGAGALPKLQASKALNTLSKPAGARSSFLLGNFSFA